MRKRRPAILGGRPAFDPALPFARPTIEDRTAILDKIGEALDSGQVTNGRLVRALEERVAATFGVEHCVAVASATTGLLLLIQALKPSGSILIPSFTFSATAHAARWNTDTIEFADCDAESWCLGPRDITGEPDLIVGVHVSGVPCDVVALQRASREMGANLIFDAAHGAGSWVTIDGNEQPLGSFGLAEVFSLTPTKVLSSAEGGLVTTDDGSLADHLRVARQYGDPGDYNTRFVGLNGRLSELHAAVAHASLDHLEERVQHRNAIARRYVQQLSEVPGTSFQMVPEGSRSSYKDLSILIDPDGFGADRDVVSKALEHEGIEHRKYYSPPVHQQMAYPQSSPVQLPVTQRLASQVLSLPIWSHLPLTDVDRVAEALSDIQTHAEAVQQQLTPSAD